MKADLDDGWYESEESMRIGMIAELQRIAHRTRVRPLRVIAVALLVTGVVTYKLATKPHLYHANIVLALTEGSLTSPDEAGIPYDDLREYVSTVLLPDTKIIELIEKRHPGRVAAIGGLAVEDFRDNLEIDIWKNSFVYYTDEQQQARKSARIGLDVSDLDPQTATSIARELAAIVIKSHEDQRRRVAGDLTKELVLMRVTMKRKLDAISREIAGKQFALAEARRTDKNGLASALLVDLSALALEQKHATEQLRTIEASPEAVADRVTEARLDTTLAVVDERRPERPEQPWYALAIVIAIIGTGSLLGAALVIGAFDARVHDVDDVTRLGLPVLGHVPGFQGDHVGSLDARGAARARVPSFLRWRSHR